MQRTKPNLSILALIKLKYKGDELAVWLDAWERYPTMRTDCRIEAAKKEAKRAEYVKRVKQNQNI